MRASHGLITNKIRYGLNLVCHETGQHRRSLVGTAAHLEQTSQAVQAGRGDTDSEPFAAVWGLGLLPNLKTRDGNSTAYLTGLLGEWNRLTHVRNASNGAWKRVRAQRVPTIITGVKTHLGRLQKSFNNFLNVYYVPGSLWIKWGYRSVLSAHWPDSLMRKAEGNQIITK